MVILLLLVFALALLCAIWSMFAPVKFLRPLALVGWVCFATAVIGALVALL